MILVARRKRQQQQLFKIDLLQQNRFVPKIRFVFGVKTLHTQEIIIKFQSYFIRITLLDELGNPISLNNALVFPDTIIGARLILSNIGVGEGAQFQRSDLNAEKKINKLVREDSVSGKIFFLDEEGKRLPPGSVFFSEVRVITRSTLNDINIHITKASESQQFLKDHYKNLIEQLHMQKREDLEDITEPLKAEIEFLRKENKSLRIQVYSAGFNGKETTVKEVYTALKLGKPIGANGNANKSGGPQ